MRILDKEVFAVSQVKYKNIGENNYGYASGFFYMHRGEIYFITNRHVVIDEDNDFFPDELHLSLHTDKCDLTKTEKFSITLREGERNLWLEHHLVNSEKVDVVALPVKKADIIPNFHVMPFDEKDLLNPNRYVSIGDDLIVVGYPLGIRDAKHKTPIIRSAIMASVYPLPDIPE